MTAAIAMAIGNMENSPVLTSAPNVMRLYCTVFVCVREYISSVSKQLENKDSRMGNRGNAEIEQEIAAVHLRCAVEDLTETGRTEFCTHAATLACRFPFSSRLPGSQADRTTGPQTFAIIKATSVVTRSASEAPIEPPQPFFYCSTRIGQIGSLTKISPLPAEHPENAVHGHL